MAIILLEINLFRTSFIVAGIVQHIPVSDIYKHIERLRLIKGLVCNI